ncbi:MAG: preprotein translocase subunit SecE [Lachnospiraceae bacterium]|jgi:preprotein translocase subunit SecE|nr:preprotein translocase subunit SecE [Lachnospiraceae bacterium]
MAEELKKEAAAKQPEKKKNSFFKGVKAEFKKIIWPSKETVAKETGAVIFFGVVLGVLIAIIDAIVKAGLQLVI